MKRAGAIEGNGPEMKIVDISGSNYQDIPDSYFTHSSCKSCLYWETEEASLDSKDREALKRKWFNSAGTIFGPCGKLVYHDGKVVAWAQYAPATSLPNARTYHTYPSEDAYLISCLAVAPGYRQRGIGETLLRAVVDDLRLRGLRAVETFARRGRPNNPSGPVEFYLKQGFKVKADDEFLPLLRLDLQQVPIRKRSIVDLSRN